MVTKKCGELEEQVNESFRRQTEPPCRILMVDANLRLCQSNADRLRQYGYSINTSEDAETAWAELQTHQYHLLVTDYQLPGLTGIGLLRKLRSACMPLPVVIAIGTLPPWKSAEYPWLLKATKLLKPYSFDDLLGMVEGILPEADRFRTPGLDNSSRPPPDRLPRV
jgi:DNA-binding response OmpR family regulator